MKGGGAEMVADSVGGLCCTEIQRERQTDSDGGRHHAPAYGALSLRQEKIKMHRFNTTSRCDFSSLYKPDQRAVTHINLNKERNGGVTVK